MLETLVYEGEADHTGKIRVQYARMQTDADGAHWRIELKSLADRPITARFLVRTLDDRGYVMNIDDHKFTQRDLEPHAVLALDGDCPYGHARYVAVRFDFAR